MKKKDIALNLPVRVKMRQPPVTISPLETVVDVMFKMINENIGAVVVVDNGRAVGIITEKDVLDRVVMRGKDVYETKAEDVMSTPLVSIKADRPIKDGLELMQKNKIKRLAVMENGVLVGLVTEKRLLEAIVTWGYAM